MGKEQSHEKSGKAQAETVDKINKISYDENTNKNLMEKHLFTFPSLHEDRKIGVRLRKFDILLWMEGKKWQNPKKSLRMEH